jgi:magnesium-protoporphyrin IX monomethyl ester (oxidative) cyclase
MTAATLSAGAMRAAPNEATRMAQQDTMLTPRFYTTDFDELDKIDVTPVRDEWDVLIDEMKSDPNRGHFTRNADWKLELEKIPEDLRKEFIDFLVSSLTAEFSGCVLYARR